MAHRRRWTVRVAVLVVSIAGGLWGLGVFDRMKQGGYYNESSPSPEAARTIEETLGQQESDVVVVYDAGAGKSVDDPATDSKVLTTLNSLPADAIVQRVSYWESKNPALADPAKRYGLVTISLAGADENARLANFERIKDAFVVDGMTEHQGRSRACLGTAFR